VAGVQRLIHLPNPQILYAVMGAMAGNMMSGGPVWMMLIGPSAGGKTLVLKSLLGLGQRVRAISSIKGEAAFLSGTDRKKMAKDATGGLLNELGDNGCLLFLDFTTIMSQSKEEVTAMLGTLRQMYDRDFSRDIGSEGGRKLVHTGRVSMLAGVTNIIDQKDEISREMGPRALYYRTPHTSGYREAVSAVNQIYPEGLERELQNLVGTLFYGVGLSMEHVTERRTIDKGTTDRVVSMAQFGVTARTHVPRDFVTKLVIDKPAVELAARMAQELGQLYIGMQDIGVGEKDRWAVLEKCTLDSMTTVRRECILAVMRAEMEAGKTTPMTGTAGTSVGAVAGTGTEEIARRLQISIPTIARTLEDLEILGVTRRLGGTGTKRNVTALGTDAQTQTPVPVGNNGHNVTALTLTTDTADMAVVAPEFAHGGTYPSPRPTVRAARLAGTKAGSANGTGTDANGVGAFGSKPDWVVAREAERAERADQVFGSSVRVSTGWTLTEWTRDKLRMEETYRRVREGDTEEE
jgi:hypothetical protein